ncbi:hypothetical protein VDIAB_271055 [Vibrio diabolicus]|nr:hypothetical protein VDIAB_271055 [Vibrio diabolicus]
MYEFYRQVARHKRWILRSGYDFSDWYHWVRYLVYSESKGS